MDLKNIFLFLYLAVDVAYVIASKQYYGGYVEKIQGMPMASKRESLWVAALSYAFLGLGWWFFVATPTTAKTSYTDLLLRAIIYALAVYGVFNATLYVMFTHWDWRISLRDTLWGMGWIALVSLFYLWALRSIKIEK